MPARDCAGAARGGAGGAVALISSTVPGTARGKTSTLVCVRESRRFPTPVHAPGFCCLKRKRRPEGRRIMSRMDPKTDVSKTSAYDRCAAKSDLPGVHSELPRTARGPPSTDKINPALRRGLQLSQVLAAFPAFPLTQPSCVCAQSPCRLVRRLVRRWWRVREPMRRRIE